MKNLIELINKYKAFVLVIATFTIGMLFGLMSLVFGGSFATAFMCGVNLYAIVLGIALGCKIWDNSDDTKNLVKVLEKQEGIAPNVTDSIKYEEDFLNDYMQQ